MDTRKESQSQEPEEVVAGRGEWGGWRVGLAAALPLAQPAAALPRPACGSPNVCMHAIARCRCKHARTKRNLCKPPATAAGSAAQGAPAAAPTTPASLCCARADSAYRELGLNKAVAAMRRGEVARVWAGPQYGYGERGSFSFPTVPPAADLV